MTKSTITREESVQAVFDLKVGYRLGFADLEILKRVARMALAAMGSSESVELPLDYLQGHKDGLEWAAQLAEANHPETGDWLYDDPIELAKAIRKGPDMPPAQPAPVAHVCTCRSGDGSLRWPCQVHPGTSPVIPDGMLKIGYMFITAEGGTAFSISDVPVPGMTLAGPVYAPAVKAGGQQNAPQNIPEIISGWIPVSERMPENDGAYLCWDNRYVTTYAFIFGAWQANQFVAKNITHWMPLPAAPQEVKSE